MLVQAVVDARGVLVGEAGGAAQGIGPLQNLGPFVGHERDVERLLRGLAQGHQAVVDHQQQLRCIAVEILEAAQFGAHYLRQDKAGVDIGDDGHVAPADHDAIGEEVILKWLGAELATQNLVDGNGVGVRYPFGASFVQTEGVEEGFHRGAAMVRIGQRVHQSLGHGVVIHRFLVHQADDGVRAHFAKALGVDGGELAA